jgi:hypothetical protein
VLDAIGQAVPPYAASVEIRYVRECIESASRLQTPSVSVQVLHPESQAGNSPQLPTQSIGHRASLQTTGVSTVPSTIGHSTPPFAAEVLTVYVRVCVGCAEAPSQHVAEHSPNPLHAPTQSVGSGPQGVSLHA